MAAEPTTAHTAAEIAGRFGKTRPNGKFHGQDTWRIPCVTHGGENDNLAIWDWPDGGIGVKCFSHNCEPKSILHDLRQQGFSVPYREKPYTPLEIVQDMEQAEYKDSPERQAEVDYASAKYRENFATSAYDDAMRLLQHGASELLVAQCIGETGEGVKQEYSRLFALDTKSGVWRENSARVTELMRESAEVWTQDVNVSALNHHITTQQAGQIIQAAMRFHDERGRKDIRANIGAAILTLKRRGSFPQALTVVSEADLDADKRYLGAPNGIIDLDTGILLLPEEGKAHLVTTMIPDAYNPDANSEAAKLVIDTPSVNVEDKRFLWQQFAWALRGRPMEAKRFVSLQGEPSSGKSTLANAVDYALGDYSGYADMTTLKATKTTKRTTENAIFAEKRIVFCEETSEDKMDSGFLKNVTGSAIISFWKLYVGQVERPIIGSLFMLSNDIPQVNLQDDAVYERYVPLHFNVIPHEQRRHEVQSDLSDRTSDEAREYRQHIVKMIVACAVDTRPPEVPENVRKRRSEHRSLVMPEVAHLVMDTCERSNGGMVTLNELWDLWKECDNSAEIRTLSQFSKELRAAKLGTIKRRSINGKQSQVLSDWRLL